MSVIYVYLTLRTSTGSVEQEIVAKLLLFHFFSVWLRSDRCGTAIIKKETWRKPLRTQSGGQKKKYIGYDEYVCMEVGYRRQVLGCFPKVLGILKRFQFLLSKGIFLICFPQVCPVSIKSHIADQIVLEETHKSNGTAGRSYSVSLYCCLTMLLYCSINS